MTTKEIQKEIEEMEVPNPHRVAELRVQLSRIFAEKASALAEIECSRPRKWKEIRLKVKTNAEAEMEYDSTPDGQQRTTLRLEMKALEKLISSCKTLLETWQGEARNMF